MAAGAAFAYACTIVCNRKLAEGSLGVTTVLGIRFSLAGVLLIGLLAVRRQPLLPARGERVRAVLLGAIGYTAESTLFFMGLERGTAAAATLLFYAYPSIVTGLEVVSGRHGMDRRTITALALSAVGIMLVVAAGGNVAISTTGIMCSLGAALAFALYFITSDRVLHRTDALTTAAWVAVGAGLSFAARGLVTGSLHRPGAHDHWPLLIVNGVATAVAFTLMFAALHRLGPSRTSVVMTLEAFFAVVLSAALLDESIGFLQALGGVAILAAAVLVSSARQPVAVVAPEP